MQPVWYFVQDNTTDTTPSNPAPPRRPNSFASADDITKESLAPYEAGSGGWGAYLDKTGPWSGHGPKGQSPIHVKVAGGVCVLKAKGGGGIAKEAYLKAGVYLRRENEKEWTTNSSYFKYAPSHLHSSLPCGRVGFQHWCLACTTRSKNKTRGRHMRSRVQRRLLQSPPTVFSSDTVK